MNKDRQLLELAAEAAGIEGEYFEYEDTFGCIWGIRPTGSNAGNQTWNPLVYDKDAFHLAIKLSLCVEFTYCLDDAPVVRCGHIEDRDDWIQHPNFPNPYVATRRAIVIAAAEVQKQNNYWIHHYDAQP